MLEKMEIVRKKEMILTPELAKSFAGEEVDKEAWTKENHLFVQIPNDDENSGGKFQNMY